MCILYIKGKNDDSGALLIQPILFLNMNGKNGDNF